MASFYQGTEVGTLLKTVKGSRFFYGLRRTDEGDLYLIKSDQLKATDGVQLNKPGDPTENYPDFQRGIEFFEGRASLCVNLPHCPSLPSGHPMLLLLRGYMSLVQSPRTVGIVYFEIVPLLNI